MKNGKVKESRGGDGKVLLSRVEERMAEFGNSSGCVTRVMSFTRATFCFPCFTLSGGFCSKSTLTSDLSPLTHAWETDDRFDVY